MTRGEWSFEARKKEGERAKRVGEMVWNNRKNEVIMGNIFEQIKNMNMIT